MLNDDFSEARRTAAQRNVRQLADARGHDQLAV
jgi:hypothetical protein